MNTTIRFRLAATSALLFAATLATPVQAVHLRSWDRKYDLASERFQVLAAFNNEAVLDRRPNSSGNARQTRRCGTGATKD